MNRADRVQLIVLACEKHLGFCLADIVFQTLDQCTQLAQRFFVFFGEFKEHFPVFNGRLKLLLPGKRSFEAASASEQLLRRLLVIPEIRSRGLLLYTF